jgi:hypothetical protein
MNTDYTVTENQIADLDNLIAICDKLGGENADLLFAEVIASIFGQSKYAKAE